MGPRPRSVAFLPDGSRAYVPSENGGTLSVVDTNRLVVVKTINLGTGMRPMGTVTAPDGRSLYVTTGRSKMLLVVDTKTNAVSASVEAGQRPWGVAISADGKTLYTANGPSNDVSVIDVDTLQGDDHGSCRAWPLGHRGCRTAVTGRSRLWSTLMRRYRFHGLGTCVIAAFTLVAVSTGVEAQTAVKPDAGSSDRSVTHDTSTDVHAHRDRDGAAARRRSAGREDPGAGADGDRAATSSRAARWISRIS